MAPRKQSKQRFTDTMLGGEPSDSRGPRRQRKRVTFADEQALQEEARRKESRTKPASKASAAKKAKAQVNATKAALARAQANRKDVAPDDASIEDSTPDTSPAPPTESEELATLREQLKRAEDKLTELEQQGNNEEENTEAHEYTDTGDESYIPYSYTVKATLYAYRLNGPQREWKWSHKVGEDWKEGDSDIIASMNSLINEALNKHQFDHPLTEYTAKIRSDHTKDKKEKVSLNDLSSDAWEASVIPVCKQKYQKYPGKRIEIELELTGYIVSRKRPIEITESPINSPQKPRNTRTLRQEDAAISRRDRNESIGEYSEQLLEKWACKGDRCRNRGGTCWIALDDKHYKIDSPTREVWANSIHTGRNGATITSHRAI